MKTAWKLLFILILCLLLPCAMAEAMTLPADLTAIEAEAFAGDASISSVIVPEGTLTIGSRAFADSGLSEITLPGSLTEIASDAFDGCTGLSASVVEGSYAHQWCEKNNVACTPVRPVAPASDFTYSHTEGESFCVITGYTGAGTSISLPETIDGLRVAGIAEKAFADCDTLTGVTIHSGILAVGKSAFSGCDNLKSVTVMEGVYEVREYAFYNCPALTTVILPDSMGYLEKYTFYNCTSLKNVVLGSRVSSIPTYCFYGCASLAEIDVPATVGYIGENAFEGCTALKAIDLPEGLARIEDNAFSGCTLLSSVTLPSTLKKIDYNAFYRCPSLSVVTLPDGLTFLASNAFSGLNYAWCSVGSYASQACSDADIPFRDAAYPDVLLAHVQVGSGVSGLCILSHHAAAAELVIPSQIGGMDVVALGFYAFGDRTDLEKVILPEGLIHIDYSTFYRCTSLSSISLPSTLEYIGPICFYGCTALTELTLPDNVTYISESALEQTGLTLVHCSVETASAAALADTGLPIADADYPDCLFVRSDNEDGTPGLTLYQYLGAEPSVVLPESYSGVTLNAIGRGAFSGCTFLERIALNEALTSIGPSAFSG